MTKCNFETGHRPIDKIELLAREVLDGKHGIGEERRKNLGFLYSAVQARVNELYLEDLKKARKNLDWLIEEEKKKCTEQ